MNTFEIRDTIVKELKPIFKNIGFKGSGTHFWQANTGFIKMFNIQSSSFNFEENVRFYLNIGLYFPLAYNFWLEETAPKNPKIFHCPLIISSSELTNRNQYFEITNGTNYKSIKELLDADLKDYIIPFYCEINDLDDCVRVEKNLKNYGGIYLLHAGLTFASMGDKAKAKKLVNEYILTQNPNNNWKAMIIKESNKRGIDL